MIYQAVGYKKLRDSTGHEYLHPVRFGTRTVRFNVAGAEADHMSQRHPDLVWSVETVARDLRARL